MRISTVRLESQLKKYQLQMTRQKINERWIFCLPSSSPKKEKKRRIGEECGELLKVGDG